MDKKIQHHGVKGMKWGIRRFQPYQKGDGPKGKFIDKKKQAKPSRVSEHIKSGKRRVELVKQSRNINKMTTKELNQFANRVSKETEYRELAKKSKDSKVRADYRRRGDMSDNELDTNLGKLRAKERAKNSIKGQNANIINVGKDLAISSADMLIKVTTGQKITSNDVMNALSQTSSRQVDRRKSDFTRQMENSLNRSRNNN